jgi:hypothetical protein
MPPKPEIEPIKESIAEQREIINKHEEQLVKIERQLQSLRKRKLLIRKTTSQANKLITAPIETVLWDKCVSFYVTSGLLIIFLLLRVLMSPREYEEQFWNGNLEL